MEFEEYWERAIRETEIEKSWLGYLNNTSQTILPYIILSKSSLDNSDTVVRKGKIEVSQPLIFLPGNTPILEGFEFQKANISENSMITFLLLRGINLPSLKYSNTIYSLQLENSSLSEMVKKYKEELQKLEDIKTALIIGPDECWQFSLLIYVAGLTAKSAPHDIKKFLEDLRRRLTE